MHMKAQISEREDGWGGWYCSYCCCHVDDKLLLVDDLSELIVDADPMISVSIRPRANMIITMATRIIVADTAVIHALEMSANRDLRIQIDDDRDGC